MSKNILFANVSVIINVDSSNRCMQHCSNNGTMMQHNRTAAEFYYGLQNETECWCGFYAPSNELLRDESECNSTCPYYEYYAYFYGGSDDWGGYDGSGAGSDTEAECGGPGMMNVYHYTSPGSISHLLSCWKVLFRTDHYPSTTRFASALLEWSQFAVSVNCGNYSAISCSYCRYDPYTGAASPGTDWCGGDCTWDRGYCVPSGTNMNYKTRTSAIPILKILGCAFESGIHYEGYDVIYGYSSDIPDLPSCLSFCEAKSRFFTFNEGFHECYCKSSNANPFVEGGTVSGETGCQTSRRQNEMSSTILDKVDFQSRLRLIQCLINPWTLHSPKGAVVEI